jgi:hypothetical protein
MKPSQAFGVAVRIVGLLVIIMAVDNVISGLIVRNEPIMHQGASPDWEYFFEASVHFVIGLYLLRWAPGPVRYAYRNED